MREATDEANGIRDETLVRCTECQRSADPVAAIAERWTYWSDGAGELLPFCPDCAQEHFRHITEADRP